MSLLRPFVAVTLAFFTTLQTALAYSSTSQSCVADSPALYDRVEAFWSSSSAVNSDRLVAVCQELSKPEMYVKVLAPDWLERSDFRSFRFLIDKQKAALRSRFRFRVAEIRKIKDRNDRIAKVYELASKAFSEFDMMSLQSKSSSVRLWDRAAQRGALLALSLEQVKLSPSEFSVRLITINPTQNEKRKTWVRLELPEGKGKVAKMDLDHDEMGLVASPLIPRFSALTESERNQLYSQCMKLRRCLMQSLTEGR